MMSSQFILVDNDAMMSSQDRLVPHDSMMSSQDRSVLISACLSLSLPELGSNQLC